jgi:hypothetical protein
MKNKRKLISIEKKEISPQENKTHWSLIKGGGDTCFVCDKLFKKDQAKRYVGLHKETGERLYRHLKCASGSENWSKKFGGRLFSNNKPTAKKILPKEEQQKSTIIFKERIKR